MPAILKRDSEAQFIVVQTLHHPSGMPFAHASLTAVAHGGNPQDRAASQRFWNYYNFVALKLFLFSCLIGQIVEI